MQHHTSKSAPNARERNFGLDLVRAIAIFSVVYGHGFLVVREHIKLAAYSTFSPSIPGVALFFSLSGFLIGGILIRSIEACDGKFSYQHITYFWKRRWMRTLPNYFLVFGTAALLFGPDLSFLDYLRYLTFTQNLLFTDFKLFFRESWSLTIEEWFYILFPLILFFLLRTTNNIQKSVLGAVLVFILFGFFSKLYYSYSLPIRDIISWDENFRTPIVTRLDAIAYGVLAAYIYHYRKDLWNYHPILVGIVGFALIKFAQYLYFSRFVKTALGNSPILNDFTQLVLPFLFINIGVTLLLPFASSLKTPRFFLGKIITHISKISYSMYLLNLTIVIGIIRRDVLIPESLASSIACYIGYWVVLIIASTILYKFFEKPIMDIRK